MRRGYLISFEGSEGCGKSTQIERLCQRLSACGREVVRVREPGGTPLGERIRDLLQHAPEGEGMSARSELMLFTASRAQLVDAVIRPAMAAGKVVVADRFLDSTTVYQGVARQLDTKAVAYINQFAVAGCLPDLTVYLDVKPALGLERVSARGDGTRDRIERERAEFFDAVRAGYLALAAGEPERIAVVNASGTVDEVARGVNEAVESRLHGIFQREGI